MALIIPPPPHPASAASAASSSAQPKIKAIKATSEHAVEDGVQVSASRCDLARAHPRAPTLQEPDQELPQRRAGDSPKAIEVTQKTANRNIFAVSLPPGIAEACDKSLRAKAAAGVKALGTSST
ncbi:hypothetical protein A0H81_11677 [Grifola frondosa]|uniref:Uncharacterized protein n=1 Tax=Grifola frondosa TaxID=5627 RepID=A0A1C7LUZ6_GRIFR|nr:hypothetical protein A0H81_11677 [Grifola frondosa]